MSLRTVRKLGRLAMFVYDANDSSARRRSPLIARAFQPFDGKLTRHSYCNYAFLEFRPTPRLSLALQHRVPRIISFFTSFLQVFSVSRRECHIVHPFWFGFVEVLHIRGLDVPVTPVHSANQTEQRTEQLLVLRTDVRVRPSAHTASSMARAASSQHYGIDSNNLVRSEFESIHQIAHHELVCSVISQKKSSISELGKSSLLIFGFFFCYLFYCRLAVVTALDSYDPDGLQHPPGLSDMAIFRYTRMCHYKYCVNGFDTVLQSVNRATYKYTIDSNN